MAEQALPKTGDIQEIEDISPIKRLFRASGWIIFGLICLTFFTLIKLPQTRIQNYIVGTINQQLASSGMQFSADDGGLNWGLGPSYQMSGIKINKTVGGKVLKFSTLKLSPAWLGLLQGKLGANFSLEEGSGSLQGTFLGSNSGDTDVHLKIGSMNLGRMGILPFFLGVDGTAELNGETDLNGNTASPTSWSGTSNLKITKLSIDQQAYMGFNLPHLAIGDSTIDVEVASGKASIKSFHLGKKGGADDLYADVTGSIKLAKLLENSDLDLHVKLGISPAVLQAFSLIDAILGADKLPDGSYAFKFVGPAATTAPAPDL